MIPGQRSLLGEASRRLSISKHPVNAIKKEISAVILLTLILVVSRTYLIHYKPVVGVDESSYLRQAQSFIKGEGFLQFDGETQNTTQPILYTIIAGLLFFITGDLVLSDKIIFVFFGGMLFLPVYLITKRLFNKRAGYIGALLLVLSTALTHTIIFSMTHIVMIFFLYMSLWLGLITLQKDDYWTFILLGISLGLIYLSRFDGLLYSVIIFLFIATFKIIQHRHVQKKKVLLNILLLLFTFCLVAFPYMNYVHNQTGEWTLSRKIDDYVNKHISNLQNMDKPLAQNNNKSAVFLRVTLTSWIKNLRLFMQNLFSNDVYPYYLAFFALLGIIIGNLSSTIRKGKIFILISSFPILSYPLYWAMSDIPAHPIGTGASILSLARYLTPIVPTMIIFSAGGILFLEEHINNFLCRIKLKYSSSSKLFFILSIKKIIVIIITILLVLVLYNKFDSSINKQGMLWGMSGFKRDATFGKELEALTGPGAIMTVFTPHQYVQFYSEAVVKDVSPSGKKDIENFINALISKGIEYLVLDSGNDAVPLLKPLLKWESVPKQLRTHLQPFFQKEITDNRWYRVYKVSDFPEPMFPMQKLLDQLKNQYKSLPFGSKLYFGGHSFPKSNSLFLALSNRIQQAYNDPSIGIHRIEEFKFNNNETENAFFFLLANEDLLDITIKINQSLQFKSLFWDFISNSNEGWSISQQLISHKIGEGIWRLESTGDDSIIYGPRIDIPIELLGTLEVRLRVDSDKETGKAQLFWITSSDSIWNDNKWVDIPIIQDNIFHTYSIDLYNQLKSKIEKGDIITQLRFDPSVMKAHIEIDYIRLSLLRPSELIEMLIYNEWIKNVKN